MIRSTNQVTQFYVADAAVTKKEIKDPSGSKVIGLQLVVDGEATDVIPAKQVLGVSLKHAVDASEKLNRKALKVALSSTVNSGAPVAGQDYTMCLRFKGFGEEDTIDKVATAHAVTGDTAATLLQKLAQSLIDNASVEVYPLYSVVNATGAEISDVTTITADGFYVLEAKPYWRLGTFTETLANIDVLTRDITVSGDEVNGWLASYKFAAADASTMTAASNIVLPNTHKVADMEYFYKGERGVSAFLNAPYDEQMPVKLEIDQDDATGYDILDVHYAYVGANASNQKSEKDIMIVCKSAKGFMDDVKTALVALM